MKYESFEYCLRCRSSVHLFNWEQASFVREPPRTSEGHDPIYELGTGQAYLRDQETGTYAWQWHFEIQWSILGSTEENRRSRILHGQG